MALLLTVATGAVAQTTYKVSVKEGTKDATSWQGKAGEGNYQALPLEGVAAGTAVSVKYSGWKLLVKSVKAKNKVKPAAEATAEDKGKLIGTDGNIYADVAAATAAGTTAVAKIIYIGPTGHATYNHGLALALTDEASTMNWPVAMRACDSKNTSTPVTDATWLLASKDQWDYMLGADGAGSYTALRDGFSSVGGSNLQSGSYWSSTEIGSVYAWDFHFDDGRWYLPYKDDADVRVRACLAFGAQGPDPIELTSTDGETWTLASMPEYDVELEVTYYTEGVELTPTGTKNEWALAATPAFDVELEVEYETALALSETTDNSAALTEWNGYEADVTLTRTLAAGSYNTFAAPFSTAIPEGWTVKELSSTTLVDGTLTLKFATATSIEAGKPYLVKVAANTDLSTAPFTGVIVSKDAQPFTSTDVDFIPTLGATTIPDGDTKAVLFLEANNTLLNPSALPANIKGFRAYFQLKGAATSARSFNLNLGDEATGIMAIGTDRAASTDNATYDLQGRKVNAAQKGVYIQNGKKVVIK